MRWLALRFLCGFDCVCVCVSAGWGWGRYTPSRTTISQTSATTPGNCQMLQIPYSFIFTFPDFLFNPKGVE